MSDQEIIVQPPTPVAQKQRDEVSLSGNILEQLQDQAKLYPRDIQQVRNTLFTEIEFVPDLAARSYYSIPYNQGKDNETRVEGLSIKAAMSLARNWGNMYNGGRVVNEDQANIYCEGVFIDLQTNMITSRQIKVSKFYKPKGSTNVVPRNADALHNAVQAGISKSVRNAILASLPDWLTHSYFQRAKELVINPPKAGIQTVKSIQERLLDGKALIMKKFKVTAEEMEKYITESADSIEDDGSLLVHLQGLYNSLSEGQFTVESVFRPKKIEDAPPMPIEKQ